MRSELEMTKKTASGSGCTPLGLLYRSPRLMLGLSFIGGFSILSSGLVIAQTDSHDKGTAPPSTSVKAASAPAPEPPARHKPVVTTIIVPVTSAPRANREYVAPAPPPAPIAAKKPVSPRTSEAAFRKPSTLQRTAETARRKPSTPEGTTETAFRKPAPLLRTAEALGPSITVSTKPTLAAPELSIPDTETVAKPPKPEISPAQIQESAQAPDSATNHYIDRTDRTIGATPRNEKPASVILSDRSTGCRTVSRNGQLLSGICGIAAPSQQTARRQTVQQEITNKQTANREIANRQIASQQTDNFRHRVQEPELPRVTSQGSQLPRLTNQESQLSKVTTEELQLPRVTTQEPQLTGVKRLPTRSVAATKSVNLGPVGLRLRGIRRSRPRMYSASSTRPIDYLPAQSFSFPESSNSPVGQAYYNLTSRPTGRPNVSNANFMFPLAIPTAITSLFGWRIHPITGDYRFHAGTDLGAPEGTPVLAAVAGQVITADFMGGYGLTVVVQHQDGNDLSLYGHLSEIFVQPGDQVEQGNVLGRVGSTGFSTGPHLHFEWRHLTPNGWVALDAGANIEYAMTQFIKSLQIAQATPESVPQRGF